MLFKEQNPIYMQIAERICDEILHGTYPEGERLPSVREYATMVEVNVNTLVRSYDWLGQNDIIFNRRGLGYFVASGAVERIADVRRNRFFHEQLPEMVHTMHSLAIPLGEVTNEMNRLIINA